MRLLVMIIVIALFIGAFLWLIVEKDELNNKYQGPVRPTDDETYFRNTGVTRPLEVE
jgi:hypothetical protein